MSAIEPNPAALGWFALCWATCCLGFLQLAGRYPLGGEASATRLSRVAVLGATALWAALVVATLRFAAAELRWTSALVAGGLLFLFLPELFQKLPVRLRDGDFGLAVAIGALALALVLLVERSLKLMP